MRFNIWTTRMQGILGDVQTERIRQRIRWGEQNHPNGTGGDYFGVKSDAARSICEHAAHHDQLTWQHILEEEVSEAFAESDALKLREELVQVAAVACAWIDYIDRHES